MGASVLGCGEVWENVGGSTHWVHTLFYTFPTSATLTRHISPYSPNTSPAHSPNTSLHTNLTPPHTLLHSPHFPHLPPLTRHLPHLPQHFPTLTHEPHTSSNTSPYSPYFIIYLIPKFLTFRIYCQTSLTIK